MAGTPKKTKKERIAEEVAKAVGAGREVSVETVDFSDPNRPKTCLEVDFPILPINQIAAIEGNAGKPIYQMSKWWARRRSSVFRSLLIAAAMKAPDDPAEAAKAVWDVYYANFQPKQNFSHLKVADIFMGGGTTIVEGARLGMQMFGCDINPVAWFVVKNELAQVDIEEVKALLADIEAEVKPQIMPFYTCDCPRGHKGTWTDLSTGKILGAEFDPLGLAPEQRKGYTYSGPEIIYVFWAKHGPCQVTGCGHRTPIMSSPVMAIKTLTVKAHLDHKCSNCGAVYDEEKHEARMAPGVGLVVAETEKPYAIVDESGHVTCPHCGHIDNAFGWTNQKWQNKKVNLSLLVHPQWLAGSPGTAPDGTPYGGSATDTPEATAAWNQERASKIKLMEVRGELPEEVICPETGVVIKTGEGTVPKKSHFACGACGKSQNILETARSFGRDLPFSPLIIQGYCPTCDTEKLPYNGRFFDTFNVNQFKVSIEEWHKRSHSDLDDFYPKSEFPYGLEADFWSVRDHGYTHFWKMFNYRQLLVHSQILKTVSIYQKKYSLDARDFVLGIFQQYLRNQCAFTIFNIQRDHIEPHFSKNNFRPKNLPVENCIFADLGRGNWLSCQEVAMDALSWKSKPYDLVITNSLNGNISEQIKSISLKQENDDIPKTASLECHSSTDLGTILNNEYDLVITDPPFGDLLQYAELSDFFYVWLDLILSKSYPEIFNKRFTPKALEAVSNKARNPENPDDFYKDILTKCWSEAGRILKNSGLLAFTFHHSEDEPWVNVLESLFDAGFYLVSTYPIRSDETKGDKAQFGSQKIEYDIIHVCCKRTENPTPISWGKMRREVLRSVRQLQDILQLHEKAGLPQADLQVIKRGKALEYYSRHYGQVYVDDEVVLSVKEALIGINQLLDEESSEGTNLPPVNAEPSTRQFLRIFNGQSELPRDQMQKYLRGTGLSPQEFKDRGWCTEKSKVFYLTDPLEVAQNWKGRQRQKLTSDYEQAVFLIGACYPNSGINVNDTLKNANFKPHRALGDLLNWFSRHGATSAMRQAAEIALKLLRTWEREHQATQSEQLSIFQEE